MTRPCSSWKPHNAASDWRGLRRWHCSVHWQAACNAGTDSQLAGVVKADDLRDVLREVRHRLHYVDAYLAQAPTKPSATSDCVGRGMSTWQCVMSSLDVTSILECSSSVATSAGAQPVVPVPAVRVAAGAVALPGRQPHAAGALSHLLHALCQMFFLPSTLSMATSSMQPGPSIAKRQQPGALHEAWLELSLHFCCCAVVPLKGGHDGGAGSARSGDERAVVR